ncbi:MAG: histidine kinase [Christiangramia sp.]|nr:histidine kinase [Christiangramia sp.]
MKNDLSSYRKKTKRQMFFLYKVLPALLVSVLTQAMFIYWNQGKIPFPLPITEIIEFIFTFLYFLGLFWIYPKISKLAYSRMMERFRSWQVNIMESLAVIFSTLAFTAIIKILPLFLILLVMDHFFDTSWQFDNVALRRSFIVHAIIGLLLYFFVEREKVQKRIRREHLMHTQLQREEFKHELENLKKQVNPEFLFSSLKSLEPLILNRPEKANKFVGRLSYLYRSFLDGHYRDLRRGGAGKDGVWRVWAEYF